MRDRLIELIEQYPCMSTAEDCFMESISSDLADYLLANGVVCLPCDVGDTLYDISEFLDGTSHPEIYELQDVEMLIKKTWMVNIFLLMIVAIFVPIKSAYHYSSQEKKQKQS